jgi:hypothetical protein
MGDDFAESEICAVIADLQDSAYCAAESGRDDLATKINAALCAARVDYADLIIGED